MVGACAVVAQAPAVLPVGGVGAETIPRWRAAGAAGFGVGSSIYRPGDDAAAVTAKARALRAALTDA
jgi:2-dehydro-3-deoxyphosphogalactonate aldolase